jgi:glycosyltransferase involved in cell wall biosynthesis
LSIEPVHIQSKSELPAAPPGKTGWPWTGESPKLPDSMPNGEPWPKISIVTPSHNQGEFIEETIRSVLAQPYPNLEYIIIDGGSVDGTVDIIRKYEDNLAYWVSEGDRGQANAINKGFEKATGKIFGWINSDDFYYPRVFEVIARTFVKHADIAMVHGYEHQADRNGNIIQEVFPVFRDARAVTVYFALPLPQLTCFWTSKAYRAVGGLDENLHYHLDYDFFLRLSYRFRSMYVPVCVGVFRRYPDQKSEPRQRERFIFEQRRIIENFITQEEMSGWKRLLLGYWYRGLLFWRLRADPACLRPFRDRFHCVLGSIHKKSSKQ